MTFYFRKNEILIVALGILCASLLSVRFAHAQNQNAEAQKGAGILVQSTANADSGYGVDLNSESMQTYLEGIISNGAAGGNETPTSQGIADTLQRIFIFMLGFVGISAFVVITYAGIQYSSSGGNPAAMTAAKNKIYQALWGIVIAALSVTALGIINPDLINFKIGPIQFGGGNDTVYSHNGITAGRPVGEQNVPPGLNPNAAITGTQSGTLGSPELNGRSNNPRGGPINQDMQNALNAGVIPGVVQ